MIIYVCYELIIIFVIGIIYNKSISLTFKFQTYFMMSQLHLHIFFHYRVALRSLSLKNYVKVSCWKCTNELQCLYLSGNMEMQRI